MKLRFTALALLILLTGCGTVTITVGGTPPVMPSKVPFGGLPTFDAGGVNAAPTSTPIPGVLPTASDWNPVATGIQWKQMQLKNAAQQNIDVIAIQVTPGTVRFRVVYQPGVVRTIDNWHTALPDALMIINANYFDTSNHALGLAVMDGTTYGQPSNRGDAAMFQVANGTPSLRSLWQQPYTPGEKLEQAAQAYPILMLSGQIAPINPDLTTQAAHRTIFAQDNSGNFDFVLFPNGGVSLNEIGPMLANSGLSINTAINMDGGQSTSLYLAIPNANPYLPGTRAVPVVLAVYPR